MVKSAYFVSLFRIRTVHLKSPSIKHQRTAQPATQAITIEEVVAPPSLRAVDRLPQEILLKVFSHVIDAAHADAMAFGLKEPNLDELVKGQRTLCRIVLVCRAWSSVASELLYSQPCLLSPDRIRLFRCTIEKTSSLCHFIKDIFFQDSDQRWTRNGDLFGRQYKSTQRLRGDILAIVNSCPSLDKITVNLKEPPMILSIGNLFLQGEWIQTPLRKLTIHGSCFYSMSYNLTLPFLKVLCLREVPLGLFFTFPQFPQLHTLQLASTRSSTWWDVAEAFQTLSSMPSLRRLELYSNKFIFPEDKLLPSWPGIEELHLIGDFEMFMFKSWATNSPESKAMDNMKHITIGFLSPEHTLDREWKFPDTLESLTVFVKGGSWTIDPNGMGLYFLADDESLRDLYQYLLSNADCCLKPDTFGLLVVNMVAPYRNEKDPGHEKIGLLLDEIRELCISRGVRFECDTITDHKRWITERLLFT